MATSKALNEWLDELTAALSGLFPQPKASVSKRLDDELAILACTGKVENPVRDKLAVSLHRSGQGSGSRCWYAREHCRVDLVKGSGGRGTALPKVVHGAVQAKAIYVADLYGGKTNTGGVANSNAHPLLVQMAQDITVRSQENLKTRTPEVCVGLLLVTDFRSVPVPLSLIEGIKYEAWVRNQSKNKGLPKWVPELKKQLKESGLKIARPTSSRPPETPWTGHANSCDLAIHWFLVVPA